MYQISSQDQIYSPQKPTELGYWDSLGVLQARVKLYDKLMKKKSDSISKGLLDVVKGYHGLDYKLTKKALETLNI